MADDSIDLSVFPSDVDLPTSPTADQGSGNLDTGVQNIEFPFCLLFAGRPWKTIPLAAPSPELAAFTMEQWVTQVVNPTMVRLGYPPNICSFTAGPCS